MVRTIYALPVDVLRRVDPTLTQSDLTSDGLGFGGDDLDQIQSYLEDAQEEFDNLTRNPQRLREVGGGDAYEYHDADLRRFQGGVRIFLDNRNVLPFDPAEGDVLELRTGRDRWKDITDDTNLYRLEPGKGTVKLFVRRVHTASGGRYRSLVDDSVRVQYRHGALGGDPQRAGQTALASNASQGDSTLTVENADRLPRSGTVLVGGTDPEYVRYSSVDRSADELQNVTRGTRGTSDSGHSPGDVVHYCPGSIRNAVAGKAAVDVLRVEDYVDLLVETGQGFELNRKIRSLTEEWEKILGKYSEARIL